jgi:hypothetical protein
MHSPRRDDSRHAIEAPKTQTLNITGPSFRHTFPGNSVTVLRLK